MKISLRRFTLLTMLMAIAVGMPVHAAKFESFESKWSKQTTVRKAAFGNGKIYGTNTGTGKIDLFSTDGTSLNKSLSLPTNATSSRTFAVCDVHVVDGKIYACNLITAQSHSLEVYCWDGDDKAGQKLFSVTGINERLGDAFDVRIVDGKREVAFLGQNGKLYLFKEADNWAKEEHQLMNGSSNLIPQGSPLVQFDPDGGYIINGNNIMPMHYSEEFSQQSTLSFSGSDVNHKSGNGVRTFKQGGQWYMVTSTRPAGAWTQTRISLFRITSPTDFSNATLVSVLYTTPVSDNNYGGPYSLDVDKSVLGEINIYYNTQSQFMGRLTATADVDLKITAVNPYWSGAEPGHQGAFVNFNGVKGSKFDIYCNGEKLVSEYTATDNTNKVAVNMPYFDRSKADGDVKAIFQVKATENASVVSNSFEAFYKDFVVPGTATVATVDVPAVVYTNVPTEANNVQVSWTNVKQGDNVNYPVDHWNIYRIENVNEGEATKDKDAVLVGSVSGDVTTFIDKDVPVGRYKYFVNASTSVKIKTASSCWKDFIDGAKPAEVQVTTALKYLAPTITEVKSYEGRNSVRVRWQKPASCPNPSYYIVERDGIVIVPKADYTSTVDMQLPDGEHTYKVTAVYNNGERYTSAPVTLEAAIQRDQAVTQYGLEEIYNYPILTSEQAALNGLDNTNAFIVDDRSYITGANLQNFLFKEGQFGAPGGLYRHGTYKNGKWYIAQMSTESVFQTDANGNKYINYWSPSTGVKGGVIEFNADNLLSDAPKRLADLDTDAATNQFVAVDNGAGNTATFITRQSTEKFYLGLKSFRSAYYNGSSWTKKTVETPEIDAAHFATGQYGRVHYASTSGALNSSAGGYIYFALNERPLMFRLKMVNGAVTETKSFKLPEGMGGDRFDVNGSDAVTSTENYAFSVAGRPEDFILEMRSEGYYYYDAAKQEYTKILGEEDARNSGGITFIYNGETFLVHPSSVHSNNVGHFAIDMAQRPNTSDPATAGDFAELVPMVSFTQKDLTTTAAANANGQWFGYEVNETENCVYIYHYVPGMRFAKYRFYSYQDYPPVKPEIKVNIKHNDDNTDITHFDIDGQWTRPDRYAHSEYNNFKIDHYNVDLLDANLNSLKSWQEKDPGYDASGETVKFTFKYEKNQAAVKHVDEETYTLHVTPVYVATNDANRVIIGETGSAQSNNAYVGDIGAPVAKGFKDPTNGWYRVDVDFNRADYAQFAEPVSYFTVDYKPAGSDEWTEIPDLRINYQGVCLSPESNPNGNIYTHNGKINGQYHFGMACENNVRAASADAGYYTDKNYAIPSQAVAEGAFKCVIWHATKTDPTNNVYRVTAHYAATNDFIKKSYSKQTDALVNFVVTGITDAVADGGDAVKAYPSPTAGPLTVTAASAIRSISIFSLSGARVMVVDGNDDTMQSIDISPLSAGIYMLSVNDGEKPVRIVKK